MLATKRFFRHPFTLSSSPSCSSASIVVTAASSTLCSATRYFSTSSISPSQQKQQQQQQHRKFYCSSSLQLSSSSSSSSSFSPVLPVPRFNFRFCSSKNNTQGETKENEATTSSSSSSSSELRNDSAGNLAKDAFVLYIAGILMSFWTLGIDAVVEVIFAPVVVFLTGSKEIATFSGILLFIPLTFWAQFQFWRPLIYIGQNWCYSKSVTKLIAPSLTPNIWEKLVAVVFVSIVAQGVGKMIMYIYWSLKGEEAQEKWEKKLAGGFLGLFSKFFDEKTMREMREEVDHDLEKTHPRLHPHDEKKEEKKEEEK